MDYEKKYKEALERAKSEWAKNLDNAYKNYRERLEFIFPELQESEDERIRKELIEHIEANCEADFILFQRFSPIDIIAWLEKQGEHKPTDMSIKEKAHQIAWETSKHYDPLLSKESWCEMAALDMASWLEKQGEQKLRWTEEDECYMGECISAIATKDCWSSEEKRKTKHWLKSLKQRLEEQH